MSALLAQQNSGRAASTTAQKNGGVLESLLKTLHRQQSLPQPSTRADNIMSLLRSQATSPSTPERTRSLPNNTTSVDSFVNSLLSGKPHQSIQQPQPSTIMSGNDLLASTAQPVGGNRTNSNNLLHQLLLVKLQHQQSQYKTDGGGDILTQILSRSQPDQIACQQKGEANSGTPFGALLGGSSGNSGLQDLLKQMLVGQQKRSEDEMLGALASGGIGINSQSSQQPPAASQQQYSDDQSQLPQHSSGSCINLPRSKRKHGDSEAGEAKKLRLEDDEDGDDEYDQDDDDEARQQHLNKLRDQLKNLNAANVMLSRYLNGLQGSLSEILAENWSFKILIGCLSSKKEASNPLEQMISNRIAENPSVAIPMLKNIHKSATANSNQDLEANSNKNAVFQNMVGLLAAQKQQQQASAAVS